MFLIKKKVLYDIDRGSYNKYLHIAIICTSDLVDILLAYYLIHQKLHSMTYDNFFHAN